MPARHTITMRELQKISAGTIQSLARPTAIKSGGTTVGMLIPATKPDPERLELFLARVDRNHAALSDEARMRLAALLGETAI